MTGRGSIGCAPSHGLERATATDLSQGAVVAFILLAAYTVAAAGEIMHLDSRYEVEPIAGSLQHLESGTGGEVLGARGDRLLRMRDGELRELARFPDPIHGIHRTRDGSILVATDADPWDPERPCRIWALESGSGEPRVVLTMDGGTALWWSLASDAAGNWYVGEYGPQRRGMSKSVWKSVDRGRHWMKIFVAPDVDGTHIHRIAVDPYSEAVWVTVGDGRTYRGAFRSTDGGFRWERVLDSQATAIAFTDDAIYFGEDQKKLGRITRLDRRSGRAQEVLKASRHGRYGGSIYALRVAPGGVIYAATMKYVGEDHIATVWAGRNRDWRLLFEIPAAADGTVMTDSIAGPDRDGWMYLPGYRFRELRPFTADTIRAIDRYPIACGSRPGCATIQPAYTASQSGVQRRDG